MYLRTYTIACARAFNKRHSRNTCDHCRLRRSAYRLSVTYTSFPWSVVCRRAAVGLRAADCSCERKACDCTYGRDKRTQSGCNSHPCPIIATSLQFVVVFVNRISARYGFLTIEMRGVAIHPHGVVCGVVCGAKGARPQHVCSMYAATRQHVRGTAARMQHVCSYTARKQHARRHTVLCQTHTRKGYHGKRSN